VKAFLLDTVTVSEFRKIGRIDEEVDRWQHNHLGDEMWISVVTPLEIRKGVHMVRQKDPAFAEELDDWLINTVLPCFTHRMLGIEISIALQAAEYRAVHGLSPNDSLIAATAKVHGLTLATRNTGDFQATGISLVNPWERVG
jgi:predicted nucleic acid-binding protein